MLVVVASKKKYDCLVYNFFLPVGLWMESNAPLQFGVHHSPQAFPKLPKESSISIRDNGCGYHKMNPNILKEEISILLNSDLLFPWN